MSRLSSDGWDRRPRLCRASSTRAIQPHSSLTTCIVRPLIALLLVAILSASLVARTAAQSYACIGTWGVQGSQNGQFFDPTGIAIDRADNIYVVDSQNHRVQEFDPDCQFVLSWGGWGPGRGEFDGPVGIATDASGTIYVADRGNNRIVKYDSNGRVLLSWGSLGSRKGQLNWPLGLAVDAQNFVYVADYHNNRVQKFDSQGRYQLQWGTEGTGNGQFLEPVSVL